ncbi:MAG: GNAT family N-acetyltransferase [Leucobacter sp.]
MTRYLDEAAADDDGIEITHEPEANRFAIYAQRDDARSLIGEAHYSFPKPGVIDFDHTVVSPPFRGTGLSGLLAQRALTSEIASTHTITASCWFIEGYLAKHPNLAH